MYFSECESTKILLNTRKVTDSNSTVFQAVILVFIKAYFQAVHYFCEQSYI